MKNYLLFFLVVFICNVIVAQKNWHLKDTKEGFLGISLDKAYKLLEGRKSQTVIVAVLDSGIDTAHIDLNPVLWRNPDEKINGIDDDGNGYIDDIYGWNFLGNSKGENIDNEAYESTRIYSKLRKKYDSIKDKNLLSEEEKKEYDLYLKVKEEVTSNYQKNKLEYENIKAYYDKVVKSEMYLRNYFGTSELNESEVRKLLRSENDSLRIAAGNYILNRKNNISINDLEKEMNIIKKELLTYYNPDTNIRALVGDDPYNINDSIYGNPDVKGPSPSHGTFVAGIIAAYRKNDNDAFGIADNVKIMSLRIVPGADERDKDIALAIRYAVKKGAKIINMSFGKPYSPEKQFVDDAIRYATKQGVLLIHAAGNEGENNDIYIRYPSIYDLNGNKISELWLNVGASTQNKGKNIPAYFSNYGKKTVDIFAPGVGIYSTSPENRFSSSNGTSAAAPVVTGVAALLMSYFPELTPYEIKDIIMKSVTNIKNVKVIVPKKNNTDFSSQSYVKFKDLCVSGGIVNAEKAVKLAIKVSKKKK
jgi:subtilisin family serine protease